MAGGRIGIRPAAGSCAVVISIPSGNFLVMARRHLLAGPLPLLLDPYMARKPLTGPRPAPGWSLPGGPSLRNDLLDHILPGSRPVPGGVRGDPLGKGA